MRLNIDRNSSSELVHIDQENQLMKTIIRISFLIIFSLLTISSWAQTVVQHTDSSEGGAWSAGSTTTPNFSSTVTLNNYILVTTTACANISCASATPAGSMNVSDTLGLNFQRCATETASSRLFYAGIFIAKITSTGTEAVTVTVNSGGTPYYDGAHAWEISGSGLTSATGLCDVSGETEATVSGGNASVSTSSSTSHSGSFMASVISNTCAGAAASGYTQLGTGSSGMKIAGAATVETATWSSGCSNGTIYEAIIAAMHDPPACSGASKVVFTSQPSDALTGASLGTVSVSIEDSSNNVCTGDTSTVTLTAHAGSTAFTLQSSSSLSKAASGGIATWTDLFVSPTAGTISIDAADGALTGATSNTVTIRAPGSCTVTVAATEAAIIAAIVDPARSNGDIVCVQAGTITLADYPDLSAHNGVTGTQYITLRGAGAFSSTRGSAGQTIFYINGGGLTWHDVLGSGPGQAGTTVENFKFLIDASSAGSPFRVLVASNNSDIATSNHRLSIIRYNDFVMTGRCDGSDFIITGQWGGVVYRNVFDSTPVASGPGCSGNFSNLMHGVENAITDTGAHWASTSTMGSADTNGDQNLYIENNSFIGSNVGTEAQTSARLVVRFNDMHSAAFDNHGYDSSALGNRQQEAYNNHFLCDVKQGMNPWHAPRGGIGRFFNNTIDLSTDESFCAFGHPGGIGNVQFQQSRTNQCTLIAGWPGSYPATYPIAHQVGWGWINGSNTLGVGKSTAQNIPGPSPFGYPTDGFDQALEPWYLFNNVNNNSGFRLAQVAVTPSECRAMAYSASSKTSDTKLVVPSATSWLPYVNSGQDVIALFADLVGGTAPSISDSCSQTWTALTGGTNNGMRLSAWIAHFNTTCDPKVTFTHDSSSAARAGTIIVLRGLKASPVNTNPATTTWCSSGCTTTATGTYDAPASGALAQTNELVIGYFALATSGSDSINPTLPDIETVSCGHLSCPDNTGLGIFGTTGGTDITIASTFRPVGATSSVQPEIKDMTSSPNAIGGTLSLKVDDSVSPDCFSGGLNIECALDLRQSDFLGFSTTTGVTPAGRTPPVEIYDDIPAEGGSFDGTKGTGAGVRASRPATCTTGVGYWSTDQGSWNNSGSGGQGVLDVCTSTNTWTNAFYVPYTYPHPLDVVKGGVAPSFSLQPTNVTVTVGQTAIFTITVAGDPVITCQWRKNMVNIGGATSCTSYTTPATVLGDNGALFDVIATNSSGNTTSNAATLTVLPSGGGGRNHGHR